MKDQLPSWRCGVNLLREAQESNTTLIETPKQVNKMSQRASCPIQLPHDERISRSQICQGLVQTFAFCFGAGHFIQKPFFTASFFERIDLECLMLFLFGDAHIADLHKLFLLSQVCRQLPEVLRFSL